MKAIILARVSSLDQEKNYSLDAQRDLIESYCQTHNLEPIQTFSFSESSTKGDRKKFHKMLDFAKKQKEPIAIVADKIDRFQRDFMEYAEVKQLINQGKIVLHFRADNLVITDKVTSLENFMYKLGVCTAGYYTDVLSENVRRGMNEKAKKGEWGHQAPIGYLNIHKPNGKPSIILDPEQAPLVKNLFEKYATGLYSLSQILKLARKTGVKTHYGKNLCIETLRRTISNPFYYGEMRWKNKLITHIYEPLISKNLYERCQNVLHGKVQSHIQKHHHLFQGLIRCPHCNRLIVTDVKKKKSGKIYNYLFCPVCKTRINENDAIKKIKRTISDLSKIKEEVYEQAFKSINNAIKSSYRLDEDTKTSLKQQISKKEGMLDRLITLYLDGNIQQEDYDRKNKEIKQEINDLKEKLSNFTSRSKNSMISLNLLIKIIKNAISLFESSNLDEKRAIIKFICSNLELDDKKLGISIRNPLPKMLGRGVRLNWCARRDSNPRPSASEADTLSS